MIPSPQPSMIDQAMQMLQSLGQMQGQQQENASRAQQMQQSAQGFPLDLQARQQALQQQTVMNPLDVQAKQLAIQEHQQQMQQQSAMNPLDIASKQLQVGQQGSLNPMELAMHQLMLDRGQQMMPYEVGGAQADITNKLAQAQHLSAESAATTQTMGHQKEMEPFETARLKGLATQENMKGSLYLTDSINQLMQNRQLDPTVRTALLHEINSRYGGSPSFIREPEPEELLRHAKVPEDLIQKIMAIRNQPKPQPQPEPNNYWGGPATGY